MKKLITMENALKGVSILIAVGGLFNAIFSKDENKALKDEVADLKKRVKSLEKNEEI